MHPLQNKLFYRPCDGTSARRIPYKIEFPDYTGEEMHQIFLRMCQNSGRICPPKVAERVREEFLTKFQNRDQNFGNGGDVRNFYEAMVIQLEGRIARSGVPITTFALEDIPE